MRTRAPLAGTAAALVALLGAPVPGTSRIATAQPSTTPSGNVLQLSPDSPDGRMDQFERRLDEIEQKHQAELRRRDEEIDRLEAELRRRGDAATRAHDADPVDDHPAEERPRTEADADVQDPTP